MHIDIGRHGDQVRLTLVTGPGEPQGRVPLARTQASYTAHPGPIHDDLLVVVALLTARPWIDRRQPVSTSVRPSTALADAVHSGVGLRLADPDPDLAPRGTPDGGRVGLAFSGGTDSVAALALLPQDTHSYYLCRQPPADDPRPTTFRTEAALESCARLGGQGRAVTVSDSDVEYLRHPMGFPHDFTTAAPVLLHADRDGLDAVAWGAPLEATYRLQRGIFRDYRDSPFIAEWGPVLRAVGLDVVVPVAGVSEVVTSLVVATDPVGEVAQSCVRGRRLGRPCGRCAKCARKTLLRGAVTGRWPPARSLERVLRSAEARAELLADPIKVEPVVAHCAHAYVASGGASELVRLLAAKTGPDPLPWLRRSYEPALALLPERYRAGCTEQVHRYAAPMDRSEEAAVEGFDLAATAGPGRAAAQAALLRWYAAHPPQDRWDRALAKARRTVRAAPARLRALRLRPAPAPD